MNARKLFLNAFLELLKTNKFESITVQMILDESTLSRTTFYRYFNDKYDLMTYYYHTYIDALLLKDQNWHDFNMSVYQFFYDNRQYFTYFFSREVDATFRDFFYNFSLDYSKTVYLKKTNIKELSQKEKIELNFYIAGSIFTLEEWIRNGFKEPISDIVSWTCELMPKRYRPFPSEICNP